MTEHTTAPTSPTTAEIHALLALALQNSKSLNGTPSHRAGVLMDDIADAGLSIVYTGSIPEVHIHEALNQPTTCTVKFGGVVKFTGRDLSASELADGPMVPQAAYDDAAGEIERLTAEINGLQANVEALTKACQRKNADCERYADARNRAVEAQRDAEHKTKELQTEVADVRASRERKAAILERERDEANLKVGELREEMTRLRAHMGKLERGEKIRQLIALVSDLGAGSVTIDGVRIEPVQEI